jgi:hypothetical protein
MAGWSVTLSLLYAGTGKLSMPQVYFLLSYRTLSSLRYASWNQHFGRDMMERIYI